ncbi:MAG: ATP-binding protein [Candidatus Thermoplasmatota archaeon]|nr:ATP-binding protein [Candidatus Thermoplasmatota archaeon]MCL5963948.1 ATP-binding protein [Candidatus Thermoplasmatota archaeon]
MARINDFKYVLTLWKDMKLPEVIERKIELDLDADKVIVIAGVRRSGKTSLMFQHIKELMKRKVTKDNVIYVNFENERLIATKATDMDDLLVAHSQIFNPVGGTIYLFLDEIQNVENWDKWIRKVYDTKKYRIIITGSSSELLSSEIATALAGRNLSYTVYPFSFSEMLKSRGITADINSIKFSSKKGTVLKALDEFLEYGSFPEVILSDDTTRKMDLLSSYFDAIFFRDIIKRYNLRETGALNIFLKIIAGNYSTYFSSTKTQNYFNSMGFEISRVTILNFLEYSKSVFLAEILEQYLKSPRKRFARQVKSYIVDIGLSRLFTDIDKGRALENAVFIELLRRKKISDNIYYLKLRSGKEIDFIVGWKSTKLIQVCYELSSIDVKNRETSALVEAAKSLKLKEGTIITYDYGGSEIVDGIKIVYLPFWEWALI